MLIVKCLLHKLTDNRHTVLPIELSRLKKGGKISLLNDVETFACCPLVTTDFATQIVLSTMTRLTKILSINDYLAGSQG